MLDKVDLDIILLAGRYTLLDPQAEPELIDLCEQRAIPVIINMHDVELARRFADRILGMSQGALVYDGPLAGLSDAQLKAIYGGQDWLHS